MPDQAAAPGGQARAAATGLTRAAGPGPQAGLTPAGSRAVRELAQAVLELRPMTVALPAPVRVAGPAGAGPVLNRLSGCLGGPPFQPLPGATRQELGTFQAVTSERLRLADLAPALPAEAWPAGALADVDAAARDVLAGSLESFCRTGWAVSADGTRVRAYAAGRPGAPAVLISSACGMPASLAGNWIRQLAVRYHVLTWETRWLLGPPVPAVPAAPGGDTRGDARGAGLVAAQAADLVAVLDHFGVRTAHVAGLCGGAVIALAAARRQPGRVGSLSLWHGDFDLGPGTPKTGHQRNLQALLGMAAQGPDGAAAVHSVLADTMLAGVPADVAHLVLCPYVTPERLQRYGQLNGAIMSADVSGWLAHIPQPAIVAASADDTTAHPQSSRLVARTLPAASFVPSPCRDHISLFSSVPGLLLRALADPAGPPADPASRPPGWPAQS